MPADFIPAPTFVWPPPAAAAAAATPGKSRASPHSVPHAHSRRRRKKKARRPLSEHQRAILADRVEAAMLDGRLPQDVMAPLLEPLFAALFPEDHCGPKRMPRKQALTAPGSPDRAKEYEARARRGESLWRADDLACEESSAAERLEMFGRMLANGRGHIVGWKESEPGREREPWERADREGELDEADWECAA